MARERPAHVLAVPKWTLAIHAVQVLLAVIVLGLSAYGIRWIAYNALIYGLIVALCTLAVCAYIVASSLFIHKLYNMYLIMALHIWMTIFWLVEFCLLANLAAVWVRPLSCYSGYYSYYCYRKRDVYTYDGYWGALVAGSVFGAFEFVTWVLSLVIVVIHINRHRANGATSAPPPSYTGPAHDQGVPLEQKYGHNGQATAQPTPQPQHAQPVPLQQQYPQPPQQTYTGQPPHNPAFTTPNHQNVDPVNRQAYTVSPVTVAGNNSSGYASPQPQHAELATPQHTGDHVYSPQPQHAELATPQHTGEHFHSPNAAELGPGQAHK